MSKLFTSYKMKGLEFKNRMVMAPMCMYSASTDGFATKWHVQHYATRAIGGVGAIILEATAIDPSGRITENDLGIWCDEQVPMLKEIVDTVHSFNTLIGIQLNHAGRKSQTSGEIVAPSPIPFEDMKTPHGLTIAEIHKIDELFKAAASRALNAGFDFIEIHGAHGYLINQFMSPLTNKRDDRYGGPFENRSLFLKEVIHSIRSVYPNDKVLALRVSAEEFDVNGNHPEDVANIINLIKDEGIDMLNVSSGGVVNVKVNAYPGYQLEYAKILREKTSLPVVGGGLIEDPVFADYATRSECCDLVFLGRELLRNPYFPLNSAKVLGEDVQWPKQYQRAKK